MAGAAEGTPADPAARRRPDAARQALRAGTHAVHGRLHHLAPFAALAAGRLDHADYVALLRRLLGFHTALEAAIAAAPDMAAYGIDSTARQRSGLLREDLATLQDDGSAPLLRPDLPAIDSAPRAMGALYVTEGSTLGGQVLARGLDGLLGPGAAGRAFLLGHGTGHAAMWRSFCAGLEQCGAAPERLALMLGGANDTFAAFEAWFAAPGWLPEHPSIG